MVDLSIVIVNWNSAEYLRMCLDSILAAPVIAVPFSQATTGLYTVPTVEILVVDCGSTDGSFAMMGSYPLVKTLALSENIGFSKASNLGLAKASGRYFLLLNPDTEILGNAIAIVINYLDTHPDVGVVGPQVLNTDGSTQPTRHHFHTFTTSLFCIEIDGRGKRRLPQHLSDYYYVGGYSESAILDVDWVSGCALFARRQVYLQIGSLDEQFFMYYEDVDWCRRAKKAGWRVVYLGVAEIVHHQGRSSVYVPEKARTYYEQSKLRYFRKYHGASGEATQRILLRLNKNHRRVIHLFNTLVWNCAENSQFHLGQLRKFILK